MIKIKELDTIYKETKYIDSLFQDAYNIKLDKRIKDNNLELLVEFGEFANETRCFKFWSKKGPNKKEIVLEEYIDCLFMILSFCNLLDVSINEKFSKSKNLNLNDSILYLYELGVKLNKKLDKTYTKRMLIEILHIADLLNFSINDLYETTMKKSAILQNRLNSDY